MSEIKLPITRYSGSKRKLVKKIWEEIENRGVKFNSVLDIFGGSAVFSYYAKAKGKSVIYNDIFRFNYFIGKALIENKKVHLSKEEALNLLLPQGNQKYDNVIERYFKDIYFTDDENKQIDIVAQNIASLENEYKKANAYYLLFQSCIIKRPYNLFHRKNLNLRLGFTGGRFGNKTTWERTFEELFLRFFEELSSLTIDNKKHNQALNNSALKCISSADLVYIDPPYFKKNNNVSYHSKYHFLEGLANYDKIEENINHAKIHKEILINKCKEFEDKSNFLYDLEALIRNHQKSILVISYRSDGIPSIPEIKEVVSNYKPFVHEINLGRYNYALNRNYKENCEYLLIGG